MLSLAEHEHAHSHTCTPLARDHAYILSVNGLINHFVLSIATEWFIIRPGRDWNLTEFEPFKCRKFFILMNDIYLSMM